MPEFLQKLVVIVGTDIYPKKLIVLTFIILGGVAIYWQAYAEHSSISLSKNSHVSYSTPDNTTRINSAPKVNPTLTTPAETNSTPRQGVSAQVTMPQPPNLSVVWPSISSQCSDYVASQDTQENEAVSNVQQGTVSDINSLTQIAYSYSNPDLASLYQEIANAYKNSNANLVGDYQAYLGAVQGYQPLGPGGQIGDCQPDESAPALYPTSYMGVPAQ